MVNTDNKMQKRIHGTSSTSVDIEAARNKIGFYLLVETSWKISFHKVPVFHLALTLKTLLKVKKIERKKITTLLLSKTPLKVIF